jgi:tetratricopeptide (TPR) repeat protein
VNAKERRILEEAEGYLELDLPALAMKALERIPAASRADTEWSRLRAQSHIQSKEHSEALPHLIAARDASPRIIDIYLQLGWCYKRTNQVGMAISSLHSAERLSRAAKHKEERPMVLYNLSCYYALARRKDKVLHWLEKAFEADPSYRRLVAAEKDFDAFRDDPQFQSLTALAKAA